MSSTIRFSWLSTGGMPAWSHAAVTRRGPSLRPVTDLFVDAHDGIRLAVRDHGGDGRPLVLLHGAGTHLLSLEQLAANLSDFRVVATDVRWSGWSGDSPVYDWRDLVRDVESVIDALSLDAPVVAGHSWGGMIAAHYGVAHPE